MTPADLARVRALLRRVAALFADDDGPACLSCRAEVQPLLTEIVAVLAAQDEAGGTGQ